MSPFGVSTFILKIINDVGNMNVDGQSSCRCPRA